MNSNIEAFGGNKSNIVLWGQSAGGASVCYHLTSPASAGLFHAVMADSPLCSDPV